MPETSGIPEGPSMSLKPPPEFSTPVVPPTGENTTPAAAAESVPEAHISLPTEEVSSSPAELSPEGAPHPEIDDDDHQTTHPDLGNWVVETKDTTASAVDPSLQPFDPSSINKETKASEESASLPPEVNNDKPAELEPAVVQLPEPEPELAEVAKEVTQEVAEKKEPEVIPMNPDIDTKRGMAEMITPEDSPFAAKETGEEMTQDTKTNMDVAQPGEETTETSLIINLEERRTALLKDISEIDKVLKFMKENPDAARLIKKVA